MRTEAVSTMMDELTINKISMGEMRRARVGVCPVVTGFHATDELEVVLLGVVLYLVLGSIAVTLSPKRWKTLWVNLSKSAKRS